MSFDIGDIVYCSRTGREGEITSLSTCGNYYRMDGEDSNGSVADTLRLVSHTVNKLAIVGGVLIVEGDCGLETFPVNEIRVIKRRDNYCINLFTLTADQYEELKIMLYAGDL
jgi:hypothetical protein